MPLHHGPRHDVHVYAPDERPLLEVDLDDGTLGYGEALQRWRDDAGGWWYHVAWHRRGETSNRLDHFPAERVRADETDYRARVTRSATSCELRLDE